MAKRLIVHPDAADELDQLYDYIAEQAGSERAWSYISAMRLFLGDLCIHPERGSLRSGTVVGLRIIGFRRRLSIAFVARERDVWSSASSMRGETSILHCSAREPSRLRIVELHCSTLTPAFVVSRFSKPTLVSSMSLSA